MATVSITADYRYTDNRKKRFPTPYWITSGAITIATVKATYGLLLSFPVANDRILVEQVVCQITTGATAGTTLLVGLCTLATDAVTTGGVGTTVDDDEFILAADITATSAGFYAPTTANTSDWLTAKIAGSWAAPYLITGAASTVPAVMVTSANAGAISAGVARVHMLIRRVPIS